MKKLWLWLEDEENFRLVAGGFWMLALLIGWLQSLAPVAPRSNLVRPPPLPPLVPPPPLSPLESLVINVATHIVTGIIALIFIAPALPALWTLFRRLHRYQKAKRA